MIQRLCVSLCAWNPDGSSLAGDRLLELLRLEPEGLDVVGEGRQWQAARVVLVDLDLADCHDDEPHEQFALRLRELLNSASTFLSRIAPAAVADMRGRGLRIDVLVDSWISDNQFDLEFPAGFLAELARLALPLALISND